MRAMILDEPGRPLALRTVPNPEPGRGELRVRVLACGVCRTDLHLVDGELSDPKLPVIPGHQIVGEVEALGPEASRFAVGDRVGVPWLGGSCGACVYCREGRENLCDDARFTGYQIDGGYAERAVADERFCLPLPASAAPRAFAPLLCAGLIGFRAYRIAGEAKRLGFYGFGASAHLLAQLARYEGRIVYAFTRPGDEAGQRFARACGAAWAGGSDEAPPAPLDAAIVFAPVGALVPEALSRVRKGGAVVCAGIHMSPIPSFDYALLWPERRVQGVANLTRADGAAYLPRARAAGVAAATAPYPLESANAALDDLRAGRLQGAAVLEPGGSGFRVA